MSSTQTIPDIAPKPMTGKYDGRRFNGRNQDRSIPRRKPLHDKHISRRYAAKLFDRFDIQEECLHLLRSDDLRLRFEVIRYLWDRLEGKPFVATNPNDVKQQAGITQDQRLQVAIQQLVITPNAAKSRKRKQLDATTATITPALPAADLADQPAIEAAAKDGGLK